MSSRSQNHLGWKLSLRSWGLTMNLTLRSLPLNCVPEHHICTPLVYLDGWLLHCFPRQPVPYIVPLLYNSALLTDNYNGSDVAHKCFKSFTQCKCKRKKKKKTTTCDCISLQKSELFISSAHDILTHFCEHG